ncbi:MAG: formylmethanofuran dehydrogenase subunit E family protein [Desulfobacteraceae bacterium]|nr:formylmethanofuran dehydrogenase subunit E family protein [Desulfobacteraceae bacterium]
MPSMFMEQPICGRPLAQCLEEIEAFHGFKAPGMVLGLFMVHRARERMGPGVEADAIVETRHCLPDAVQLFTPCTVGNGWLKILDWDKYALSLYDRHTRDGCRVWFDLAKARAFPVLYQWFMRLAPKKALPLETLLEVVLTAGAEVLSERAIRVTGFYQRQKKAGITLCPDCGEAFAAVQGDRCLACQGRGYYRFRTDSSLRSG